MIRLPPQAVRSGRSTRRAWVRRAARTRRADVARWATDALPAAVEREACGVVFREAHGSACVVFAFESGANVVVDLPETTRGAVYRAVLKHADALLAARAGAPPPPLSAPRRDDACLAALLSACCVVCVRRAGREAAAAAFLAAGVALLARASGGPRARAAAGRRRRGWQATALDGSHTQAGRRDAPRPRAPRAARAASRSTAATCSGDSRIICADPILDGYDRPDDARSIGSLQGAPAHSDGACSSANVTVVPGAARV